MSVKRDISRRSFSFSALSAGLSLSSNGIDPYHRSGDAEDTWPSFQGDARNSGLTENEGPKDSPDLEWSVDTGDSFGASPVVHEDVLCIPGGTGTVYGIDAITGDQLWTHSETQQLGMTPAVFNEKFVVPSLNPHDHRLVALEPEDGRVKWELRFEQGAANPPTVADESLFITRSDGGIVSYGAGGTQRWEEQVDSKIWTSPAVAENTVVVGSFDGVHAFDAASGSRQWTYPIQTVPESKPGSAPTIVDGTVIYCGGYRDRTRIVGLDLDDGTEVFSYPTDDVLSASPAVTEERLVVGTSTHLLALNWRSGTEVWRRHYYDMKTNGDVNPIGSAVLSSPVISGETVYVGTQHPTWKPPGRIYGLSLSDGETEWEHETKDVIISAPGVAHGRLYVGDFGGTLYAISGKTNSDLKELGLLGGGLAALGGGAYAAWRRWGRESDPGDS